MSTKMKLVCMLVVVTIALVGMAMLATGAFQMPALLADGSLTGHCVVGSTGCIGT
jgi:hypothetical protein